MGGLGRVTLGAGLAVSRDWPFLVIVVRGRSGARLPRQPVCRLEPGHGEGDERLLRHGLRARRARGGQGGAVRGARLHRHARRSGASSCWRPIGAPPDELIARVAADCGLAPPALTFILTPTTSLAGAVQITARVLEVALHKVHALGFPAGSTCATGWAARRCRRPRPISSPPWAGPTTRSCSAARCSCSWRGPEAQARELAEKLPSSALARLRQALRQDLQGCRAATSTRSTRCCSARRGFW